MRSTTGMVLAYGAVGSMFPSTGMRMLSAVITFFGISILAHCLSRRLATERLSTIRGWKDLAWPRFCILVVMLSSWCFLLSGGILMFGVELNEGTLICSLAIHFCVAFYSISKLFIYCFLIEKVYVVWAPTTDTKRFQLPIYIVCVVTVALYSIITILMYIGSIHYFRNANTCVMGISLFGSIPLLSYDIYVNLLMTCLFLWPLVRTGRINGALRRIASRTLIGSIVALTTSTVNILMLTLQDGKELGWVCLGSCGADVICNALALFWVTSRSLSPPRDIRIGISGNITQDVWAVDNDVYPETGDTHGTLQCSFTCGKTIEEEDAAARKSLEDADYKQAVRANPGLRPDRRLSGVTTPPRSPLGPPRALSVPHSSSKANAHRPMDSVTGYLRKNDAEEQPEIRTSEVATQLEIVEEAIEASGSHPTPRSHLEP